MEVADQQAVARVTARSLEFLVAAEGYARRFSERGGERNASSYGWRGQPEVARLEVPTAIDRSVG